MRGTKRDKLMNCGGRILLLQHLYLSFHSFLFFPHFSRHQIIRWSFAATVSGFQLIQCGTLNLYLSALSAHLQAKIWLEYFSLERIVAQIYISMIQRITYNTRRNDVWHHAKVVLYYVTCVITKGSSTFINKATVLPNYYYVCTLVKMFCNFIHNYIRGLNYDNLSAVRYYTNRGIRFSRNYDYITKPLKIQIRHNDPSPLIFALNK